MTGCVLVLLHFSPFVVSIAKLVILFHMLTVVTFINQNQKGI